MAIENPHDLLIECSDCGVENIFSEYSPEQLTICNQCREMLIQPDFNQTHNEYQCDDCGFVMCLAKDTPFEPGKTACRCQSFNIVKVDHSTLYEEAEEAGAFDLDEEELETSPSDDWCRSDLSSIETSDDYNEMFDMDPSDN
ncbi:MAG: hypothetical protein OEZ51_03020 [Nitrospinota bacterium]|nr:hypothetical protein [Nitrospinota bacterium]